MDYDDKVLDIFLGLATPSPNPSPEEAATCRLIRAICRVGEVTDGQVPPELAHYLDGDPDPTIELFTRGATIEEVNARSADIEAWIQKYCEGRMTTVLL